MSATTRHWQRLLRCKRVVWASVLAAIACRCMSLSTDVEAPHIVALSSASKSWSCPVNRLTPVLVRSVPSEVLAPPADIAPDHERLAIWRANHEPRGAQNDYRIEGCGIKGLVHCEYHASRRFPGWRCDEAVEVR